MGINTKYEVEDELNLKGTLYVKYADNSADSIEEQLENIVRIMFKVKNANVKPALVLTYKMELEELFFKLKQNISYVNGHINELSEKDKYVFDQAINACHTLKEEYDLIDFDAVLDYTLTKGI